MGWMELLVIGVVALIVVGPKDLPVMFHSLGKMSAKVRRMAREFSSAMSDAAKATGASEMTKDLRNLTSPKAMGMDVLRDAADTFDKWEPGKEPRVMGSETAKLAAERAEAARKIREATAAREQAKREAPTSPATETAPEAPPPAKPARAKSMPVKQKPPKAASKMRPAPKAAKPRAAQTKAAKAAK